MDEWTEEQVARLTAISMALAVIERETLALGMGELCDLIYAARQPLSRARANLCEWGLR
jgi:hypothetical protein